MTALTCEPWITGVDISSKILQTQPEASDVTRACQLASSILYALTGRRWRGQCTRTDLTLHVGCACPGLLPDQDWALRVGYDSNTLQVNDWGLHRWHALRLPDYPVRQVTALAGPGGFPDLADVRIARERDLWVEPFGTAWRRGDYVLSYGFGAAPPDELKSAAGILAGEFLQVGQASCRLPARVQSITRQGVSMVLIDPLEFLDKGRTGIPEVDLIVGAVNPGRLATRPRVINVDSLISGPYQSRPAGP